MNILKGGKKKTFRIDKLTKKQWDRINNCKDLTCGITTPTLSRIVEIPNLIFKNNCVKHDLMTRRGGGIVDWFWTNYYFWKFNYIDVFEFWIYLIRWTFKRPVVNAIVYMTLLTIVVLPFGLAVATLFSLFATIGDIFAFSWGRYRTLEAILKKAKC